MDILTGFEGILQVDGYTGYDALAEAKRVGGTPMTLAYCRGPFAAQAAWHLSMDGSDIAAKSLRRIAQIYKVVASVRGRSPEERLSPPDALRPTHGRVRPKNAAASPPNPAWASWSATSTATGMACKSS